MKVSISVLTYNRADILKELLESLCKISYSPLEIIVIDNHSSDETEAIVKKQSPKIKYLKTPKNIGVAARNKGLSKASGDIVITLDDDIIGIDDSDINALVALFESRPDIGAICFKVVDYHSGNVCNWCHHYQKEEFCDREFVTDEITEGAVAFRKSVLDKAGFYPAYFFISHEGPDLLCRMLDAGYKTLYSPEVCVRHRTHQAGRATWRRYYYDTRNQIWVVARNYPILFGLKYLVRGLTAMLLYSIRDGFLSYWIKGIWHGLKDLPKVLQDRKPVSKEAVKTLKEIASNRPSLIYTAKQRMLRREIRL